MALWKPTYAIKSGIFKLLSKTCFLLIVGSLLSGCVSLYDPESSHEWHADVIYVLQSSELVSQTFVLPQSSVSSITLWISPLGALPQEAKLIFSLFDLNQQPKHILTTSQPLSACRDQKCTFTFPDHLSISKGKYALFLESNVPLQIWGNLLDSYPAGNFSINNQPTSADLAFSVEYRYTLQSAQDDLIRFLKDLWIIIPTLACLVTPGLLILKIIRFSLPEDQSLSFYIILSTSLAVIPLLLAWSTLLKVQWQGTTLQICLYLLSLYALWTTIRDWRHWVSKLRIEDFLLYLVFLLALLIRLLMARNLVAPAWVDSVHHALITQLILKEGAFPSSYQPYLDIDTTSYHSGFHANLALYTWLSNLPLPLSMLVFGQILNALAVYSTYVFALSFYPNRTIALVAAIMVAFFSPMPAYYTSWGRYTQLCGLLILPTLVYIFKRSISIQSPFSVSTFTTISILFAGLIVIHYRVSLFFALLLCLVSLEKILYPPFIEPKQRLLRTTVNLTFIALTTLVLSSPWLPEAWSTLLLPKLSAWRQPPATPESIPLGLLTPALGKVVLLLAALGLLFEIIRRSWQGLMIFTWVVLCFATVYLSYYGLRGIGFVNMTSVAISLYLPLSTLAGQGVFQLLRMLEKIIRAIPKRLLYPVATLVILISAVIGGRSLIPLLNPITMLVRADDLEAMQFIHANLPSDQTLMIQPFLWGYGLYAGADGGSWIPALAERVTIPPPVLFALSDSSDQIRQINQISQAILEKPKDPDWIAALMLQNQISYLYLGARGGAISPWELIRSSHFHLIYHQGGVFIFKIQPPQSRP